MFAPAMARAQTAAAAGPTGRAPRSATLGRAAGTCGEPLAAATRAYFEPRFGHNFATVRIHSDEAAGASARALSARAYTVGHDIVFAPGLYRPGTTDGQRLLAHELAHVVQQSGQQSGQPPRIQRQPAGEPDEPLDVLLEREQRWDDIAQNAQALEAQLAPIMANLVAQQAAREEAEEPFFVKANPALARMKATLQTARAALPAELAAGRADLHSAERAFLAAEDALAALEAEQRPPDAGSDALAKLFPLVALLRGMQADADRARHAAAQQAVADKLASIRDIQARMDEQQAYIGAAEEYIRQMRQQLTLQGLSAARRAGATTEAPVAGEPVALARTVTLLQTMIEASRLLAPYVTGKRAINLRTPGRFVVDAPDAFAAAKRAANIGEATEGTTVGGFYDRRHDTIHLPQAAHFGEALHEAIHKYSSVMLRNMCHDLNEGVTQYVADAVLQEQGLPKAERVAYQDKVDCAARLIHEFGFDAVATLYFAGTFSSQRLFDAVRRCGRYC
ncbi:MAG: DUF4157 domain-containing protein [Alphaproteobacteria bacterium]|nr:DUF4157 domain-containing protein [Alphaproteobacteria bacterium]